MEVLFFGAFFLLAAHFYPALAGFWAPWVALTVEQKGWPRSDGQTPLTVTEKSELAAEIESVTKRHVNYHL